MALLRSTAARPSPNATLRFTLIFDVGTLLVGVKCLTFPEHVGKSELPWKLAYESGAISLKLQGKLGFP